MDRQCHGRPSRKDSCKGRMDHTKLIRVPVPEKDDKVIAKISLMGLWLLIGDWLLGVNDILE